jgi:hypothetical protein
MLQADFREEDISDLHSDHAIDAQLSVVHVDRSAEYSEHLRVRALKRHKAK